MRPCEYLTDCSTRLRAFPNSGQFSFAALGLLWRQIHPPSLPIPGKSLPFLALSDPPVWC
ncbi:hypothetical protein GUJ93_ZPchr0001g30532 [Zizania palustris]|uniref:Uncharacterized protein n=1 Tax=Zizania palustris TaxID=103762 RepID=A0A8J5S1S1_ZIZPA|nr:hypothetical protein GUJ93_ZPchr0001g30532 [Zizania palustris]